MRKLLIILILILGIPSVAISAFPDGWTKTHSIKFISGTKILFLDFDRIVSAIGSSGIFDSDDAANLADNGGGDIRFSSDAAGAEQVPCEVVSFVTSSDAASSSAEIYIPGNTDGIVYMWWHNTGQAQPAVDSAYGRNAVWTGYAFVSHDGGYTDSTGNHTSSTGYGSISGGSATGKFGNATAYNGTTQYFTWPDADILSFGNGTTDSPYTMQAWVYQTSATYYVVFSKYNLANSGYEYIGLYNNGSGNGKITAINMNPLGTGTGLIGKVSSAALTTGRWSKIETTYAGSGGDSGFKIFSDNVQLTDSNVGAGTYTAMTNGDGTLNIGRDLTCYQNGAIDELRIYAGVLTENERALEYYNQSTDVPIGWGIVGWIDLPPPPDTLTNYRVCLSGLPSSITDNLESDFADFRPTFGAYTPLHFEIPDTSNPNNEIWINIPSYSPSGNGYNGTKTRIFIWGNNASATMPTAADPVWGSNGVYNSSIKFSSHMNDAADTSHILAGGASPLTCTKTGAANPATGTGLIGSSQTFNGSTSAVTLSGYNNFSGHSGTVSILFKTSGAGNYILFSQSNSHAWSNGVFLFNVAISAGALYIQTVANSVNTYHSAYSTQTNTYADGNWHLVSVQSNGITWTIYVDGAVQTLTQLVGTNAGNWFSDTSNAGNIDTIGKSSNTTYPNYYSGHIDDIAIYDTTPSAALELFQAQNLLHPDTFATYGIGNTIPISTSAALLMR